MHTWSIPSLRRGILFLFGVLFLGLGWLKPAQARPQAAPAMVWPVSGSASPDLPQSSAYGPRLQAGNDYAYDYHQGLDIPTPISTTLVAVMTGTVRIAGSHPAYSDGVVQLDHGGGLYSNYLHIRQSLVVTDQVVGTGQPVALSGVSDSGFAHLHFEIRQGSFFRRDAVNPLRYLPYPDSLRQTVTITEVQTSAAVWVQATWPADELDVQGVRLRVFGPGQQLLDERRLDYEARNLQYLGDPAVLDNPDLDNIFIAPQRFGSASTLYVVNLYFHHLTGSGPVNLEACAIDLRGGEVCTQAAGQFGQRLFLALLRR